MQKYAKTTWELWKLLKPFQKYFYIQLVYIVAIQLLNILSVVILAKSINNIVDKNYEGAAFLVVIYFLINFFKTQADYYKTRNSNINLVFSIQQYLQEYSMKNIFKLNAFQYLEDHSSIKQQVIGRGEDAIQNIISTIFLNLVPTVTQIVFSITAIAWYCSPVAGITLLALLIGIFWTNRFTNFHRPFIKRNIEIWDIQRKARAESFQHLLLVKTFGVEKEFLKNYIKNREAIIDHAIITREHQNLHNTRRWNMFALSNMLSRLTLVYYAFLGKVLIGDIYAVWSWISEANGNIFNVIQAMRQIPINYVELEKYLEIINKEPEFNEKGDRNFVNGNIVFENVRFQYPKADAPAIHNLNITIPAGKKVAFVGFSGSGKSTIIKLLLRIYDWSDGDIKLNGKSLRNIDARTLRQKIGYVEQHVDLFDTSIRDNILFGLNEKKLKDEELLVLARKARIDQFFDRLGDSGLDTIIGERGVKLSGGERQRIGIARALAKNPEILIFDEATASLDTENEKYIQEAIDESSKGRTTIIIAHRLSTVQNSDIIFVMDKGEIVATGTHAELLEKSSEYQRLIHAQHS